MNHKFESEINNWLEKEVKPKVKLSTYDSYKYRISKYICPHFENYNIKMISEDDIQHFVANLKGASTSKKLSPSTVDGIFIVLMRFFKNCVKEEKIEKNPCVNVTLPKKARKKVIVLSIVERKEILKALQKEDSPRSNLITTALLTGMRLGELCSLKWQAVDLKNKVIFVKSTNRRIYVSENKTKVITTKPKTEDSIRIIPISTSVEDIMRKMKLLSSEYVFPKSNGFSYDNRSIQQYFKLTSNQLGIKRKSFHVLRHTFATLAVESNMDIKTLSMILGHRSVVTTMNLYVHPNEEHLKMAMEKVSKFILN